LKVQLHLSFAGVFGRVLTVRFAALYSCAVTAFARLFPKVLHNADTHDCVTLFHLMQFIHNVLHFLSIRTAIIEKTGTCRCETLVAYLLRKANKRWRMFVSQNYQKMENYADTKMLSYYQ